MSEVILIESPAIEVGKWLRDRAYVISDGTGERLGELTDSKLVGILKPDPNTVLPKKFLGIVWSKPKQSELLVAFVYFKYYLPPCEDWRIDVHGSEYLAEIKQLANDMAETFARKIWLQLVSEDPIRGPLVTITPDMHELLSKS
jgi:hypothetical protein